MTSLKKSVLAIAAAVALTLSVSAQQPSTSNQQTQGSHSMDSMQGMQGMEHGGKDSQTKNITMESCQKNMKTMMQSNQQLKKTIADAKASNDTAKMQSALSEAEKYVDSKNEHMKTCMNMMQNMQGMGGMMSGPENRKKEQNTPPQQ